MVKVVIGMPYRGMVVGWFFTSVIKTIKEFDNQGWDWEFVASDAMPIAEGRNQIISHVMKKIPDADYILWLDTDMLINSKQSHALIDYLEENKDVTATTGLYFMRGDGFKPLAFMMKKEGEKIKFNNFMPANAKPHYIDACGMGCFALRMSHFKEHIIPVIKDKPIFKHGDIGEDMYFCMWLKLANAKLVLLPYVEVPHYGMSSQGWCYESWKKLSKDFKRIKVK